MNYKKLAFGLPSILSIVLTLFISYIFYFNFIPLQIKKHGGVSAFFLGVLHTCFMIMTLWSLLKTMLTNPGYLPITYQTILLIYDSFKYSVCIQCLQQIQVYKNPRNSALVVKRLNQKHYERNNLMTIQSSIFFHGTNNIDQDTEDDAYNLNGQSEDHNSTSSDELDSKDQNLPQLAPDESIETQSSSSIEQRQKKRIQQNPSLDQNWQEVEKSIDERFPQNCRSFIRFRYCHKCKQVKPPRTHHCSICNQCVMRMDHHCPWVGNCVGIKNHKFFFNFLFWSFIGCTHAFIALILAKNSLNEFQRDIAYMFNLF